MTNSVKSLSGDEDKDVDEIAERVEEIKLKDEDKKTPDSPSSKKKKDPLNWFGVLVPQALKASQKHFKQVRLISGSTLHYSLRTGTTSQRRRLLFFKLMAYI